MPTSKFPDRPFLWPGARAHELPKGARMATRMYGGTLSDFFELDIFVASKTHDPEGTYIVTWLPKWELEDPVHTQCGPGARHPSALARRDDR